MKSRIYPTQASLDWSDKQPRSRLYDDVYFSDVDPIAESQHVFLAANDLYTRFQNCQANSTFVIGETGFGAGLNFLMARALWLENSPADTQLHFISCERYPLKLDDLRQVHNRFPTDNRLTAGIEQLQAQWPLMTPGFHRLCFDDGRVQLTLLYGDASEQLEQMSAEVDCWFLDGFAPAKNPDIWSQALFKQIARLSHPSTTLTTYTIAGVVKRGLVAEGFSVERILGFGRKMEMTLARYCGAGAGAGAVAGPNSGDLVSVKPRIQPWLSRPPTERLTGAIAIIGAGLSGACTANALARRGYKVDLYEQHSQPASEGSGNPQGALYAKLPAKPTTQSRLHQAGLLFTIQLLKRQGWNDGTTASLCGLLQLGLDEKERIRFEKMIAGGEYPPELLHRVSREEASLLAGTECNVPAIYFPNSGWVSPPRLTAKLLEHPNITVHCGHKIEHLERHHGGWDIIEAGPLYDAVIFCTAWRTDLIDPIQRLGLKPIRGQTTWGPAHNTAALKRVVCGNGYVSPPLDGQYCFGSSFIIADQSTDIRQQEHRHNLEILTESLPQLGAALSSEPLTGKAAQRAGSRDYMPLVGGLCNQKQLQLQYAALSTDARQIFEDDAPWLSGLYVNLGHGSKGLISCPLSAEIIAAQIHAEPYPVEQELVDILSPQRFTIRGLIRGE